MKITEFSLRRPVTLIMIVALFVIAGLFSVTRLPLNLFPNLNLPIATVRTVWLGADSNEVEQQVTNPIEAQLQSLSNVADITSTSSQGSSVVVVEFNFGANLSNEINDIRSDISQVQNQLPSDSQQPIVEQYNPNDQPIMTLSVSGTANLSNISDVTNNIVVPALEHLNGVGQVNSLGALTRQVTVQVDPHKLAYYHLGIQQVTQALEDSNFNAQVGQANRGNQLIPMEISGEFASANEIGSIPISDGNSTITLNQVANVTFGNADVQLTSNVNGHPDVSLGIIESSNANTVDISDEVQKALPGIEKELPQGIKVTVLSDSSQIIRQTLSTVETHTLLGFLFGIIIMLLILRSLRTTLVVAIAIPIAVLTTFSLMYAAGITLDTTTLGSLAVGLGSLVDFSIVVVESIYRARQRGLNAFDATRKGTDEVGVAVVIAAIAQICVFAPAIFTAGIAGQFFRPIAMTVSFSHIAALLVAITVSPLLASRLMKGRRFEEDEQIPGVNAPFHIWSPPDWVGRGMHGLIGMYRRVLQWALDHRKTVIISSFLMFIGSLTLIPHVGFQLFSTVYNSQIQVDMTTPDGTSLAATTQLTNRVVKLAKKDIGDVQSYYMTVGSNSPQNSNATNSSQVTFTLPATDQNDVSEIANRFQSDVASIPGAQITVSPVQSSTGAGSASSIAVDVEGPDMNTLQLLSNRVADIMEENPNLQYVDNPASNQEPTYNLVVNESKLSQYGLTETQVETALRQAFNGYNASTFWVQNTPYNVVVQFPESFSRDISNLSQISIMNGSGETVPLDQLVTLQNSSEMVSVDHTNDERSIEITANLYGASEGKVQQELSKQFKQMNIPNGYSVGFGLGGQFINSAMMDLGLAVVASIVLLYMVMASLFESLLTPFVIMFCLPPTFIGAALGLFLTHRSLDIDAMVGAIMVIGLVANNAIVLVDYTNRLKRSGMALKDALVTAGPVRLRPILMSTLTTVLAMLPLVLGFGTGANTLDAMATVIACGLLFSTAVTLLLVPVMYVTLDNLGHRKARKRRSTQQASTLDL